MNTIKQTLLREIEANAAWCSDHPGVCADHALGAAHAAIEALPLDHHAFAVLAEADAAGAVIERDFVARWCFSAGTGAEFVAEIERKAWEFVLAHGEDVACCV